MQVLLFIGKETWPFDLITTGEQLCYPFLIKFLIFLKSGTGLRRGGRKIRLYLNYRMCVRKGYPGYTLPRYYWRPQPHQWIPTGNALQPSLMWLKAFDKVWMDGPFFQLYEMEIRGKIWHILYRFYIDFRCCIRVQGNFSEWYNLQCGIH